MESRPPRREGRGKGIDSFVLPTAKKQWDWLGLREQGAAGVEVGEEGVGRGLTPILS